MSYFDSLKDEVYGRGTNGTGTGSNASASAAELEESYDRFSDEPDSRESMRRPQQPRDSSNSRRTSNTTSHSNSHSNSNGNSTSHAKKKKRKKPKKTAEMGDNASNSNSNSNSTTSDYTTTSAMSYSRSSNQHQEQHNQQQQHKETDILEAYRRLSAAHAASVSTHTGTHSGTARSTSRHRHESEHVSADTTPSNNSNPTTSTTHISTDDDVQRPRTSSKGGPTNMRIQTTTRPPPQQQPPNPSQPAAAAERRKSSTTKSITKQKSVKTIKNGKTNNNNNNGSSGHRREGKSPSPVLRRPAPDPSQQHPSETLPNQNVTRVAHHVRNHDYASTKQEQEQHPSLPPSFNNSISNNMTAPPMVYAAAPNPTPQTQTLTRQPLSPPHDYTDKGEIPSQPPVNIIPQQRPSTTSAADRSPHRTEHDSLSSILEDQDMDPPPQPPRRNAMQRQSSQTNFKSSRRFPVVRAVLRSVITKKDSSGGEMDESNKRSVKKGYNDESSQNSASTMSRRRRVIDFLSRLRGNHPPMTEEERRRAGNPFLNRPTPVRMYSTYGAMGHVTEDQLQHDRDHTDGNHSLNSHSFAGTSVKQTFQQKYCPLPWPLKFIQKTCGTIVTNQKFQVFMIFLIMLNALVLGLATYDWVDQPTMPEFLDWCDKVLLTIFTVELGLQFGYCGYTLFLDGWLVFDALTVISSWWLDQVQVFRSMRIFRSFRLIVRLPLLKNLVLTVFHVIPRINSILMLLILIIYVYGVLCTILFSDMYELGQTDENYFGRLDLSLFTLFQMVTLADWGNIVRQVREVHSGYASLIFVSFVIFTGFIMYNLIVAVMCDSMLVVEAQGREEIREKKKEMKRLNEIAKVEQDRMAHYEMVRQRKEDGVKRRHLKGLIGDDATVSLHDSSHESENDDGGSWEHLSFVEEDEEEEAIEYRVVQCEECECVFEIEKFSASERYREMLREEIVSQSQERVRSLQQKISQMAETQKRVTAVLQTLMRELEAARMSALNHGSVGDMSYQHFMEANDEEKMRLGKDQ